MQRRFHDIVYPIFLSLATFAAFAYLTYKGPEPRRLASVLEEELLAFSLAAAGPRKIVSEDQTLIVLYDKPDLLSAVAELLAKGVKQLVIIHNPLEHLQEPELYIQLQRLRARYPQRVWLSVPGDLQKWLPRGVLGSQLVVDGEPCQNSLQLVCKYEPRWENWLPQRLINRFSDQLALQGVSRFLPRQGQAYVYYPVGEEDIAVRTYADVTGDMVRDRIVFLEENRPKIPFSLIASDFGGYQGMETSFFFAALVQQFIDGGLVRIWSPVWSQLATLVLSAFLVLIFYFKGVVSALGLLVCYVVLTPLVNALAINFFGSYLLVFDILFMCLWLFIILAFTMLVVESLRYSEVLVQRREEEQASEAKVNFLSLISHNLNTPVAKVIGLVEVLAKLSADRETKAHALTALGYAAEIQLAIRFTLVAAAVEDGRVVGRSLLPEAILRDLKQAVIPPLSKLGLAVKIDLEAGDDFDLPWTVDLKLLSAVVAALVVRKWAVGRLAVEIQGDDLSLIIAIELAKCATRTDITVMDHAADKLLEQVPYRRTQDRQIIVVGSQTFAG